MNSLKRNPGLLLIALTLIAFTSAGCHTTHWPQGYTQSGVPIDSGPLPESDLGNPTDLGTGADSLMRNESTPSDSLTTRKPTEVAKTPQRPTTVNPPPSHGKTILLGEPGTKPLSQYFAEDFQRDLATVKQFPVTETPQPPKDSGSELVRGLPKNDLEELRIEEFDVTSGAGEKPLDPSNLAGPDLPLFTESASTSDAPDLKVNFPESIPAGKPSSVTVLVSGIPPELAAQFHIKIQLSDSLRQPGDNAREFELLMVTPAGEPRNKLSFPILATKPGTHSFEVSLRKGEEELAWKKISVSAKAELLSIALTGPESKPFGSNAEYTLNVHNTSQESLGPITAIIEFDGTLIPREASEGAEQKSGRLVWQFPVLHPDEQIFLQVEFECPVESAHACITARVQAGDRPPLQEQSCLKIFRPNGSIRLEVEDRNDLARPDQELTAIIRITNLGLQPARNVRLSFDLPESLRFKSHTTTQGNNKVQVPLADQLIQLLFEPVAELKPDQTLEFQITFDAVKAGEGILQARVTDEVHTEPLTAAEPFTVTP